MRILVQDEFTEHVQERHPTEKEDEPNDPINKNESKETAPSSNINIEAASTVVLDNIVKDAATKNVSSNVEIVAIDKDVPSRNIDIVATYSQEGGDQLEFILPSNDILEQAITQELNTDDISADVAKNTGMVIEFIKDLRKNFNLILNIFSKYIKILQLI